MMYARILIGLVLALALIASACGRDGETGTGAGETPVREEEARDGLADSEGTETIDDLANGGEIEAVDEAGGEDRGGTATPTTGGGSGTVTIGEVIYEFQISRCDLEPTEEVDIDIIGKGTAPDGRLFHLWATHRTTPERGEEGSFGLQYVTEESYEYIALASPNLAHLNNGEEPSFQVVGSKVTATATFYDMRGGGVLNALTGVAGTFEASCP